MIKIKLTQSELDRITSVKNFKKDINIGEIGENMTKQYLEQRGLTFIRKSEERTELKKWDLEFKHRDKPFKFEIKNDVFIIPDKEIVLENFDRPIKVKGKDTKNIFIEYHSRGVPSGISTTTADVWVNIFFHLNQMWIIEVDKLKRLIDENDFPVSEESGDIGSHTKGYLIPRFNFENHFKVVKYEREVQ
jgi:hypothetical protein